jgi:hypothetical protein
MASFINGKSVPTPPVVVKPAIKRVVKFTPSPTIQPVLVEARKKPKFEPSK